MESLSSLKGLSSNASPTRTRRVVSPEPSSDDISSLLGNEEEGEKKTREGGRARAWREVFECLDLAEQNGWDLDQLRAHLKEVYDNNGASASTGKVRGGGKQFYYCAVSKKGNRIIVQTNDTESLKEQFVSLYRFARKSHALDYCQLGGEAVEGTQVF